MHPGPPEVHPHLQLLDGEDGLKMDMGLIVPPNHNNHVKNIWKRFTYGAHFEVKE